MAEVTDDMVYLRVADAASILGLSTSATKRIPPAELPYTRVARRGDRRYLLDDLRAYLAAGRVEK